jgi:hypothetical protein
MVMLSTSWIYPSSVLVHGPLFKTFNSAYLAHPVVAATDFTSCALRIVRDGEDLAFPSQARVESRSTFAGCVAPRPAIPPVMIVKALRAAVFSRVSPEPRSRRATASSLNRLKAQGVLAPSDRKAHVLRPALSRAASCALCVLRWSCFKHLAAPSICAGKHESCPATSVAACRRAILLALSISEKLFVAFLALPLVQASTRTISRLSALARAIGGPLRLSFERRLALAADTDCGNTEAISSRNVGLAIPSPAGRLMLRLFAAIAAQRFRAAGALT